MKKWSGWGTIVVNHLWRSWIVQYFVKTSGNTCRMSEMTWLRTCAPSRFHRSKRSKCNLLELDLTISLPNSLQLQLKSLSKFVIMVFLIMNTYYSNYLLCLSFVDQFPVSTVFVMKTPFVTNLLNCVSYLGNDVLAFKHLQTVRKTYSARVESVLPCLILYFKCAWRTTKRSSWCS